MTAGVGLITGRAEQDPRHPGAARHADLRGRVRHPVRRLPARGPRRRSRCCRPTGRRSWSWRRRSRTRCARRRTSSSGSGRTRCRWPGSSSTGRALRPAARCPPDEATAARRRGSSTREPGSTAAGLLRLHADRARLVEREAGLQGPLRRCPPDGADGRGAGPGRATCTTSTDCVTSGSCSRADLTPPAGQVPGGSDHTWTRDGLSVAGGLEHGTPRGVRLATQQGPALTLGHAAPHAPLDLVVERLGEALGPHRARLAHQLGLVLLGTPHEECVRLSLSARC